LNAFKQGANPNIPDEAAEAVAVDHARLLVDDCRKLLLGPSEFPIGAWGLINADPVSGDPEETEIDCVLILTSEITRFEKVPLDEIYSIEFGTYQQSKMFATASKPHLCLCINYCIGDVAGFFHMFRSANIRFFNNVAIPIEKDEEVHESLNTIVELFKIALTNIEKTDVHFTYGTLHQRRKSRSALLNVPTGMPRNLSESQLVQIGSKAFSNVAGQFSKLGQSLHRNNSDKERAARAKAQENQAVVAESAATLARDDNNLLPDEDKSLPNPFYNENSFLPSVGIVMSQTDCDPINQSNDEAVAAANNANNANIQGVDAMSISLVTDINIKMPGSMLCNPDITVTDRGVEALPGAGSSVR
jgi:phosphatidylinositol 4-phosphatase